MISLGVADKTKSLDLPHDISEPRMSSLSVLAHRHWDAGFSPYPHWQLQGGLLAAARRTRVPVSRGFDYARLKQIPGILAEERTRLGKWLGNKVRFQILRASL